MGIQVDQIRNSLSCTIHGIREQSERLVLEIDGWLKIMTAFEDATDQRASKLERGLQDLQDSLKVLKFREDAVSQIRQLAADRLAEIKTLKDQLLKLNEQYKTCVDERNAARAEAGNLSAAISRALGSGEIKVIGATETEAQRP